jgi:hypothetical protein
VTKDELKSLTFFRDGERDLAGRVLDWEKEGHYATVQLLEALRRRLDSPLSIIRLAHPGKPTAIDWCCLGRRYRDVVCEVLRLPHASYGFYSGHSVHTDLRTFTELPARWLAVKEAERPLLGRLDRTVTSVASGWAYLPWTWDGLQLVIDLAEKKAGEHPSGN